MMYDTVPEWAVSMARRLRVECLRQESDLPIAAALVRVRHHALEEGILACAREQNYREYRADKVGDQDGSGIVAAKEIASYLRACQRTIHIELPSPLARSIEHQGVPE